jgi:hypothetical protein
VAGDCCEWEADGRLQPELVSRRTGSSRLRSEPRLGSSLTVRRDSADKTKHGRAHSTDSSSRSRSGRGPRAATRKWREDKSLVRYSGGAVRCNYSSTSTAVQYCTVLYCVYCTVAWYRILSAAWIPVLYSMVPNRSISPRLMD